MWNLFLNTVSFWKSNRLVDNLRTFDFEMGILSWTSFVRFLNLCLFQLRRLEIIPKLSLNTVSVNIWLFLWFRLVFDVIVFVFLCWLRNLIFRLNLFWFFCGFLFDFWRLSLLWSLLCTWFFWNFERCSFGKVLPNNKLFVFWTLCS